MKAYAWANGRIDFGRTIPEGALIIAEAPAEQLREAIEGCCRLAYDGKTLLVPGVSESGGGAAAVDALIEYSRRVMLRLVSDRHDVTVRYRSGAYVVRSRGQTVGCTMSAEQAVKRLTEKLWGEGPHGMALLKREENLTEVWGICKVGRAA